MIQAARSGVANIIEGSEASATSKKTELKLTDVAKASQEELISDYKAFLRQRGLSEWSAESPEAQTVRRSRPESLNQLRKLMALLVSDLFAAAKSLSDKSDKSDRSDRSDRSDKARLKQEVAANTMLCLINQETYLLGRQIARLAAEFEENGGFTERLYRVRTEKRGPADPSNTPDRI